MNSGRSAKAYYIAAFILGALIALIIASPAHSSEPFVGRSNLLLEIQSVPNAPIEFPGALQ